MRQIANPLGSGLGFEPQRGRWPDVRFDVNKSINYVARCQCANVLAVGEGSARLTAE